MTHSKESAGVERALRCDPRVLLVGLIALFSACQSDQAMLASMASSEDGHGAVRASVPKQKGFLNWQPECAEYVGCDISWSSDVKELRMTWMHNRMAGEVFFTGLDEVVWAEEAVLPTRFYPREVQPIPGTKSFLVWGISVRGEFVLERWSFEAPVVTFEEVLAPSVTSVDDLGEYEGSGIAGLTVFYDLMQVDPITGYAPPRTVLFKLVGGTELLMVDLADVDAGTFVLAGPGPGMLIAGKGLQPSYLIAQMQDPQVRVATTGLVPGVGQLMFLRNADAEPPYTEVVVVLDSDLDGVPDTVNIATKASMEQLGLINEGGPATGYDADYYVRY